MLYYIVRLLCILYDEIDLLYFNTIYIYINIYIYIEDLQRCFIVVFSVRMSTSYDDYVDAVDDDDDNHLKQLKQ